MGDFTFIKSKVSRLLWIMGRSGHAGPQFPAAATCQSWGAGSLYNLPPRPPFPEDPGPWLCTSVAIHCFTQEAAVERALSYFSAPTSPLKLAQQKTVRESHVPEEFGRHVLFLTLGAFSCVWEGHPCCLSQRRNFSGCLVRTLHTQDQDGPRHPWLLSVQACDYAPIFQCHRFTKTSGKTGIAETRDERQRSPTWMSLQQRWAWYFLGFSRTICMYIYKTGMHIHICYTYNLCIIYMIYV